MSSVEEGGLELFVKEEVITFNRNEFLDLPPSATTVLHFIIISLPDRSHKSIWKVTLEHV